MIDHAKHINALRERESEDARIAEMERRSAPLFWLVYILAFVVCCWVIYEQYKTYDELARMRADFETVQHGGIIGVGDDAVMACTVRKIIGAVE